MEQVPYGMTRRGCRDGTDSFGMTRRGCRDETGSFGMTKRRRRDAKLLVSKKKILIEI